MSYLYPVMENPTYGRGTFTSCACFGLVVNLVGEYMIFPFFLIVGRVEMSTSNLNAGCNDSIQSVFMGNQVEESEQFEGLREHDSTTCLDPYVSQTFPSYD